MDFYDIPPTRKDESADRSQGNSQAQGRNAESQERPFLGVTFECCKTYARVYRNAAGTHYAGTCPRCARPVKFKIGEGGSGSRFWTAGA